MWGLLWVPLGLPFLAGFHGCRSLGNDGLQSVAFRLHEDVAIVLEHLLGNMSGDVHDGLIASAAFRKVGDERVPVVVPTAFHLGVGAHIVPCRLEGGNGARGVTWTRLSEGKDIPLGAGLSELLPVPNGILGKNLEEGGVQRDGRPSPASVLLRPTARNFFVKSICSQVKFPSALSESDPGLLSRSDPPGL